MEAENQDNNHDLGCSSRDAEKWLSLDCIFDIEFMGVIDLWDVLGKSVEL